MKVKANCRINYNGDWHVYGDVFEMDNASASALGEAVTEIKEATVIDTLAHSLRKRLGAEGARKPKIK